MHKMEFFDTAKLFALVLFFFYLLKGTKPSKNFISGQVAQV